MPMATRNPGATLAAAHQNAIVDALKGTVGENLTVFAKGADLASVAALVLGTDGNYFDITGTTNITSISSLPSGTVIKLQFDGALTLVHNATNLILSGGVSYLTAAGDIFEFISEGSGNWRETHRGLSAISTSVASTFGATPSLAFGTTNAAGTGSGFVRRNATIALYDTTVARALAFGDVGTVGSAGGFAAHVLHGHPFASGATVVASVNNFLGVGSTNGQLQWVPVNEARLQIADNTTGNVSTSAHGFTPKAPNNTAQFLRGDAAWAALPASGYTQGCRLSNSGNQTVNTASTTLLTWDTEDYDTDTMHEGVTNPGRITFTTTGVYLIWGQFSWSGTGTTGVKQVEFNLNAGATRIAIGAQAQTAAGNVYYTMGVYSFTAGDYIVANAYQDSGGALVVYATGSYFGAQRIG